MGKINQVHMSNEKYEEIVREAEWLFKQTKIDENVFSTFSNPFITTVDETGKDLNITTGLSINTL